MRALLLAALWGCAPEPADEPCPCDDRTVRLATTTSVDSTGLLGALVPPFEARTGIAVHVLAVGTGQALELARNGDVDVVLVHDPAAEEAFLAEGAGVNRRRVMHNDLVVIGPPDDPAGARGADAAAALARVAAAGAPFVSRGDRSGTHAAELRLWAAAGIAPAWDGYAEAGQGMRPTLTMADEKHAYTLTDRASFVDAEEAIELVVLVEGDERLLNVYSAMATNPARHEGLAHVEAMAFVGWLTSAEGQRLIGDYRPQGRPLFVPDAVPAP